MNRTDALARVTLLGATASRPALTAEEVSGILDQYAIPDANGNAPQATSWVETYDVHAAVAECFRVKAGRVAGDFSFSADDTSVSKGDVLAHLLDMEAKYAAMAGSASGVGTGGASTLNTGKDHGLTIDELADRLVP